MDASTSKNEKNSDKQKISLLKEKLKAKSQDIFDLLVIYESISNFEENKDTREIREKIWAKKFDLIFPVNKNQKAISSELFPNKPEFTYVESVLHEGVEILGKDNTKINKLKDFIRQCRSTINNIKKATNEVELNKIKENCSSINCNFAKNFLEKEIKLKKNGGYISSDEGGEEEIEEIEEKKKIDLGKKNKSQASEKINSNDGGGNNILITHVDKVKKENDELQKDIKEDFKNFNSSARRKSTKKKDEDFIYDEDILEEEESNNKILKKKKKRSNSLSDDESYNEKSEKNYLCDSSSSPKNDGSDVLIDKLIGKKQKKKKKNVSKDNIEENFEDTYKINNDQILNKFIDILKENQIFMKEGILYITSLATKLKNDLLKNYPYKSENFEKTLENMYLTLKELGKYKKVCHLIIKGKITLFIMAKFPYGEKFINKLKSIENRNTKIKKKSFSEVLKNAVEFNDELNKENEGKVSANDLLIKQMSANPQPIADFYNNNNNMNTYEMHIQNMMGANATNINQYNTLNNPNIQNINTIMNISNMNQYMMANIYNNMGPNNSMNLENSYENSADDKQSASLESSLQSIEGENAKFSPETHGLKLTRNKKGFNNLTDEKGEEVDEKIYDPFSTEITENSVFFPVLYDPELYPLENSNKNLENSNETEKNADNTLLRVYHGQLKLNHNILENVSFFSTNSIFDFQKFPKFKENLFLPSRARAKEVINYCLKQLNSNNKTELFGWIEPDLKSSRDRDGEIKKFIDLITDFGKQEKCNCLVEDKIKLYIFTLGETDGEFYNKKINDFKFVDTKIFEMLQNEGRYLVFVLIASNEDLDSEVNKKKEKIEPELVKTDYL